MYKLTKKFRIPMGHRLSKHKGRCKFVHGHNFTIEVTVVSNTLNDHDMVIDFGDLKRSVKYHLDKLDHSLLLNKCDVDVCVTYGSDVPSRTVTIDGDPTAENLAKYIWDALDSELETLKQDSGNSDLKIETVTVWENEDSKVSFNMWKIAR